MHSLLSLAIMLLPFTAFFLVLGGRMLRTANQPKSFQAKSAWKASPSATDAAPSSTNPARLAGAPRSGAEAGQADVAPNSGGDVDKSVNVPLTLDDFEVIADALEFTGQYIEKEITDATAGTEEHALLLADLEEVNKTMEVVTNTMEMLAEH